MPRVETTIHTSPKGAISLKVLPEPSIRVSHPITLDKHTIQAVLSGVYVHEEGGILDSLLKRDTESIRVFTPEEVAFLTPWLIQAFSTATPEESIEFHVGSQTYTSGSIYVLNSILHFSLIRFQDHSLRSALLSRPSNSFSRPKQWQISFDPDVVIETNGVGHQEKRDSLRLAINLSHLSHYLASSAEPVPADISTDFTVQPERSRREHPQESTMEDLRKEMQQLRQTMEEQNRKVERLEHQAQPK